MRRLAVCTLMFFLVILASGVARGGRAVAYMQVSATILPWLHYTIIEEPGSLDVGGDLDQYHEGNKEKRYENKHDRRDKVESEEDKDYAAEGRIMEVERGTVISIATNTTDGYILSVQSLPSTVFTVVKVEIKERGQSFFLTPGASVDVHLPYYNRRNDTLKLSYNFTLSPDAEVGSYPWPIIVSVHPL